MATLGNLTDELSRSQEQASLIPLGATPDGQTQYLLVLFRDVIHAATWNSLLQTPACWLALLFVVLLGCWLYRLLSRLNRLQQAMHQTEFQGGDRTQLRLAADADELEYLIDQTRTLHYRLEAQESTIAQQTTQLLQRNLYDPLTGLPNRDCFMFELGRYITSLQRHPAHLALILLEINGLKQLWDQQGHDESERLLQQIAQLLRQSVREADQLSHLGADRFALIITHLQEPEQIHQVMHKLYERLEPTLQLGHHDARLHLSAGIVPLVNSTLPACELLHQAELALQEARLQNGSRYQLFTAKIQEKSIRNHFIEQRFHEAIRTGELCLHFQPIRDSQKPRVLGLEALSRWQLPIEGNIPPAEFIPILEQSILGLEFGHWVIEQAMKQLYQLDLTGLTGLQMAINLTGQQLRDPELLPLLNRLGLVYHIMPSRISFEINEQALRLDYQAAQQVMRQLHEAGFRLTLDDFGTGYSALTYLSHLPFDFIKLDPSFTIRMLDSDLDRQLVGSIIQMAHSLDKRIIGEGIDNTLQSLLLQEMGCDQLQGLLFAAPIGECDLVSQLTKLNQPSSLPTQR